MSVNSEAVVYTPDYVVVPDKNGKPNLHTLYRDASGKQVVNPNPNPVATAKWELHQERFRGTSTINAPVMSSRTGAMSAGTVTVIDHRGKREVFQEVLEKARIGGRALGKGAATVGRAAALNTPYGRAFNLALLALEGSKYFWNDEKGDFVRPQNDKMYVVLSTPNASSNFPDKIDEQGLFELCANNNCQKVAVIEGQASAYKKAEEFCKSRTYQGSGGTTYNYDSIGWSGYCYDSQRSVISGTGVKVVRWVDYVPMTLDEFIEEGTPEAAQKPNEWVETSEVKPTDEPKVKVPAGSVAQSDPYTDPKDKKVKQTRWDFDTNGRVRETEILRPDLTPDSPEAPELQPPVEETPKDGDKDKDKESASEPKAASAPADLCEKNPDILACDKQPEKPEEDEFPEIPTETINLSFQPDSIFPNAGQCPAPVAFQAMGGTYQISTQPACDIAIKMRPFIIALTYLAAAFFVIRTIRAEAS